MLASQLIKELKSLIEQNGDLIVTNDEGITVSFVEKLDSPYRKYIQLNSFGGWDVFEE